MQSSMAKIILGSDYILCNTEAAQIHNRKWHRNVNVMLAWRRAAQSRHFSQQWYGVANWIDATCLLFIPVVTLWPRGLREEPDLPYIMLCIMHKNACHHLYVVFCIMRPEIESTTFRTWGGRFISTPPLRKYNKQMKKKSIGAVTIKSNIWSINNDDICEYASTVCLTKSSKLHFY